jgi:hypothetical protein
MSGQKVVSRLTLSPNQNSVLAASPEPELNVEAERSLGPETVHRYDGRIYIKGHEHNEVCKAVMAIRNTTMDGGIPILEALIQQVSDRRVGEFAAKLKTKAVMGRAGEKPDPFIHKIIDQTLADYLSHKTLL